MKPFTATICIRLKNELGQDVTLSQLVYLFQLPAPGDRLYWGSHSLQVEYVQHYPQPYYSYDTPSPTDLVTPDIIVDQRQNGNRPQDIKMFEKAGFEKI